MILELKGVESAYGMSQILFGVDLQVNENQVACLLGRNGVGKSTTVKTVMGLLKPKAGSIVFKDREIGGLTPYKINKLGIAYVPQGRQVFPTLTVKETAMSKTKKSSDSKGFRAWLGPGITPIL